MKTIRNSFQIVEGGNTTKQKVLLRESNEKLVVTQMTNYSWAADDLIWTPEDWLYKIKCIAAINHGRKVMTKKKHLELADTLKEWLKSQEEWKQAQNFLQLQLYEDNGYISSRIGL